MTDLESRLRTLPQPYVVMSVGIPCSGKSTVLQPLATALDIVRISPDEIRKEITGSEDDQSVNKEAWDKVRQRAQATLKLGRSVIVDGTHTEAWRRREEVEQYRLYGAVAVVAVFFDTPLRVAKRRNTFRERTTIEESVLEKKQTALKRNPVCIEEGFDQVITLPYIAPGPRPSS